MQKIWREELRSIEIDDCSYDSILSWAWCTVSKDILSLVYNACTEDIIVID